MFSRPSARPLNAGRSSRPTTPHSLRAETIREPFYRRMNGITEKAEIGPLSTFRERLIVPTSSLLASLYLFVMIC